MRNNSTRAASAKFDVSDSFLNRWKKEFKEGFYDDYLNTEQSTESAEKES
jgi:transposase